MILDGCVIRVRSAEFNLAETFVEKLKKYHSSDKQPCRVVRRDESYTTSSDPNPPPLANLDRKQRTKVVVDAVKGLTCAIGVVQSRTNPTFFLSLFLRSL